MRSLLYLEGTEHKTKPKGCSTLMRRWEVNKGERKTRQRFLTLCTKSFINNRIAIANCATTVSLGGLHRRRQKAEAYEDIQTICFVLVNTFVVQCLHKTEWFQEAGRIALMLTAGRNAELASNVFCPTCSYSPSLGGS